jgi:hypothetical protein
MKFIFSILNHVGLLKMKEQKILKRCQMTMLKSCPVIIKIAATLIQNKRSGFKWNSPSLKISQEKAVLNRRDLISIVAWGL